MPIVQKHDPGTFCWCELGTTDRVAAVAFYTKLFGWSSVDAPMDKDVYTMFQLQNRDTGAVYAMTAEMLAQGIPPHWLLYVSVASVDDAVTRINEFGGTVVMGPFDVMDMGRMAVAKDPQGAALAVWQPMKHIGIGIQGGHGSFCWPELMTSDAAAAKRFYGAVFNWGDKTSDIGNHPYTEWQNAGKSLGGMMEIQKEWGPVPPHWMGYFEVDDCDATVALAEQLGATIVMPQMEVPTVGRMAQIKDPQGAHFSVIQLIKK